MKGIIIGRFQGFHNGHQNLIWDAYNHLQGIKEWDGNLNIYIGSAQESRTRKNPFNFFERKSVILDMVEKYDISDVFINILPLIDCPDSDSRWLKQIEREKDDIIFGNLKDESSYYLQLFTDIHLVSFPQPLGLSATSVRELFYAGDFIELSKMVPEETETFLSQFMMLNEKEYKKLCE